MNKELSDLAWRCLPREFKEEVKKDYKATTDSPKWDEAYNSALEETFGYHNLTSDAEGEEDEMLYVSRKEVQEMYSVFEKFKDKDDTCFNLATLFGPKCLPDEACNVASPSQNSPENCDTEKHISTDCDKPAEPKFKRGDTVIYKPTDKRKVVYGIDKYGRYCVVLPNMQSPMYVYESDLKPYTEPKYHKGEKVCYNGYVYEVEGLVGKNRYALKGLNFDLDEDMIDPYEPCTEPKEESPQMKPIESKVSVYLATKEEDEEFRLLLYKNGFKWKSGDSLISDSHWTSDSEENKIHYVYPDKIVAYCGDKTSDTLAFSEFKKRYFDEDVNLSKNVKICDKQFDTIIKDGFSKERRLNIAKDFVAVLLSRLNYDPFTAHHCCCSDGEAVNPYTNIARIALSVADALIYESQLTDKK